MRQKIIEIIKNNTCNEEYAVVLYKSCRFRGGSVFYAKRDEAIGCSARDINAEVLSLTTVQTRFGRQTVSYQKI